MEGYVIPEPLSATHVRAKSALVYAAGPGAELLVLGGLILALGWGTVFNESQDVFPIALKTLAVVILIGAGLNLIPFRVEGGVSDGLGILLSPFQSRQAIEFRLASVEVREVLRLLNAGNGQDARLLVEQLIEQYPENFMFNLMKAEVLAACGNYVDAEDDLNRLQRMDLSTSDQRTVWHVRALIELEKPTPEWPVADIALQNALETDPKSPELLITKGASLVLRGRLEEGGQLLADAFRQCDDRDEFTRALAYLTIAAHRYGDADAADRFREAFEHFNASKVLTDKVESLAPRRVS
jgi:tetratricopeptide (TPR) repeat protein